MFLSRRSRQDREEFVEGENWRNMRLQNKVTIITGAAHGIGKSLRAAVC